MAQRRPTAHARIQCAWMLLPAWKELSGWGVKLLIELMGAYRPDRVNAFEVPERLVAEVLGCSRAAARRAIDELIEIGWTSELRRGGLRGAKGSRCRVISLTTRATETAETATEDFKSWGRETADGSKSRHARAKIEPFKTFKEPL